MIEVSDSESSHLRLGHLVSSLRGRDAGRLGIVIKEVDERFVLVADGDKRKFDKPKKKNVLHLEWLNHYFLEVVEAMEQQGRVSNAKLRYLIQSYQSDPPEVQRKGE